MMKLLQLLYKGEYFYDIPYCPKLRSVASTLSVINYTLCTNFTNEKYVPLFHFRGHFLTKFQFIGDSPAGRTIENGVALEKLKLWSQP